MGWLDDMADPDTPPKGPAEWAEKQRQDRECKGPPSPSVVWSDPRLKSRQPGGCIGLILLLVLSMWAVAAMTVQVAQAVTS